MRKEMIICQTAKYSKKNEDPNFNRLLINKVCMSIFGTFIREKIIIKINNSFIGTNMHKYFNKLKMVSLMVRLNIINLRLRNHRIFFELTQTIF